MTPGLTLAYVITTCGNQKMPHVAPAAQFYRGSFVAGQGRAARALSPRGGRLILSNKHGYMRPDHIIPGPYDSHWGYPDTMADEGLLAMIATLDLRPGDTVVCLGAHEYARQTRRLFPDYVRVLWPAKHLPDRRMGFQGRMHQQITRWRSLPAQCIDHCEFLPTEVNPTPARTASTTRRTA